MARKKSQYDLFAQSERIRRMAKENILRGGDEQVNTNRALKAIEIANRYSNNIRNNTARVGVPFTRKMSIKYSRQTYMGLAKG